MQAERLVLQVLREIEELNPKILTYAYKASNTTASHVWWEVSVSSFDLYMNDQRFEYLRNKWHKEAKFFGIRLVFVCRWTSTESFLWKLADADNLVLNI